jgi:DNA-binding transcriptional MerR regulator
MNSVEQSYTIGVVARRTKIHPETLRIWERRYSLVVPDRNDTGRRLYSETDIVKLSLVKKLTDIGHPVGGLAELPIQALRERLSSATGSSLVEEIAKKITRVVVAGEALSLKLKRDRYVPETLEVLAYVQSDEDLSSLSLTAAPDVLVLEFATINEQSLDLVQQKISQCDAKHAVIVYSFGTRASIALLEQAGIPCLKNPAAVSDVQKACVSLCSASAQVETQIVSAKPRRYSAQQLAYIATLSSTVACECPNHLAELVTSLIAFEQYSSECANRNAKDAELHAHLNHTTGLAREMLEDCMTRLLDAEGIKV